MKDQEIRPAAEDSSNANEYYYTDCGQRDNVQDVFRSAEVFNPLYASSTLAYHETKVEAIKTVELLREWTLEQIYGDDITRYKHIANFYIGVVQLPVFERGFEYGAALAYAVKNLKSGETRIYSKSFAAVLAVTLGLGNVRANKVNIELKHYTPF